MKRLIGLFVCLGACLSLLAGCGAAPAPSAAPSPSPRPTVMLTKTPTQSPTATPDPLPSLPAALQGRGEDLPLQVYVVDTQQMETLPVEEYLCGVLAGEMRDDWPEEALRAQAIVARTFLLYFLEEKGGSAYEGADISTDIEESQAYYAAGITDKIRQAVQDTEGMVLVHEGAFINAWFSSCAGGRTAMATEGLGYNKGDPPYIQVVDSPEEEAPAEFQTWSGAFTLEELRAAAEKLGVTLEEVDDVSQAAMGPSGRTTLLKVGEAELPAPALRVALGSERFRSTYLTKVQWDPQNQVLEVEGKGFGHGVGMSQWGAYTMAMQGKTAEEILTYYFKDVELVQVWGEGAGQPSPSTAPSAEPGA